MNKNTIKQLITIIALGLTLSQTVGCAALRGHMAAKEAETTALKNYMFSQDEVTVKKNLAILFGNEGLEMKTNDDGSVYATGSNVNVRAVVTEIEPGKTRVDFFSTSYGRDGAKNGAATKYKKMLIEQLDPSGFQQLEENIAAAKLSAQS